MARLQVKRKKTRMMLLKPACCKHSLNIIEILITKVVPTAKVILMKKRKMDILTVKELAAKLNERRKWKRR